MNKFNIQNGEWSLKDNDVKCKILSPLAKVEKIKENFFKHSSLTILDKLIKDRNTFGFIIYNYHLNWNLSKNHFQIISFTKCPFQRPF